MALKGSLCPSHSLQAAFLPTLKAKIFDSKSYPLALKQGRERPGWSCTGLSLEQNVKPHPQYFPADHVTTAFKACLWPKADTVVLRGHGGCATHYSQHHDRYLRSNVEALIAPALTRFQDTQKSYRSESEETCWAYALTSASFPPCKMTVSHIYLHVEIHRDGPSSHQFFHEVTSPVSVLGMDSYIWAGKKSIFMTKIITAPHLSSLWQPISTKRPSSHSDSVLCFASLPSHLAEGITITEWTGPSRHSTPLI